jgi:hypothetical protein
MYGPMALPQGRPRVWWHSANKRCTDQNSIFYV